jgi:triosephosphate isomerase (TIM)
MRVKLVAGNWKMNGTLAASRALVEAILPRLAPLARAHYAVCVPFPYLAAVRQALDGSSVALGAQNVCQYGDGAYTGEISGTMLADCGCRCVIVGHSERRALFGDTDEVVAMKYERALKHGLMPILCVGEVLAERESGATEQVVARQLDAVMRHCGVQALGRGVIAYEPVWAIGTGKTATPEQAQTVHAFIRGRVAEGDRAVAAALRILYGGSVKAGNAAQLFAMPDVDGGLIGGASLVADEFVAICRAAQSVGETVGTERS